MAPYSYPSITIRDLSRVSTHGVSPIKSSPHQPSAETTATIVFGLCAVAVGTITIWQSDKARKIWHSTYGRGSLNQDNPVNHDNDLEPGNTTSAPAAVSEGDQPSTGSNPRTSAPPPPPNTETSSDLDDTQPNIFPSQETLIIESAHTSQRSLIAVEETPSTPPPPSGARAVKEESAASDPIQTPQI